MSKRKQEKIIEAEAENMENKPNEVQQYDDDTLIVKVIKPIAEGNHVGTIKDFKRDFHGDYDYIDVYIETTNVDGEEAVVRAGFPTNLSTASTLGKFLMGAGIELEAGKIKRISELKSELLGRTVAFETFNEETDDGLFARVENKSITFR